jgi:preprotein translocase subunit SecD
VESQESLAREYAAPQECNKRGPDWQYGVAPDYDAQGNVMAPAPAAGLREAKVSGTDSSVYLHAEAIVTNSDILRAYIIQVDHSSQYNVGVDFNPSGAEKIRAATARHIGKPVAILLDGKVVTTAIVREPIAESAAVISGLSRTEAEKIVKGITTIRWCSMLRGWLTRCGFPLGWKGG